MTLSIALRVPLSQYLGYGQDGIGIAMELEAAGADVHIVPGCLVDSPLPSEVAYLFTKPKKDKYDISLHHLDPDGFDNPEGWEDTGGLKVGWTMWEFSNFKNASGYDTMRKRLKPYDLFFVYDTVTAEALREVYDGEIRVLQGGFVPENYPFVQRDWFSDRLAFCMLGQLHDRKDPWVAIQAFNELKDELGEEFAGAELHLKNSMAGALFSQMNEVYKDRKIRVYNEIWDKPMVDEFYANMHCLLAPSRGEGKNLPALEFQSTGGVVIATNWGGHTQWMRPSFAYPLNYVLRPVNREHPETFNARASVDHLKELMLQVYRNRGEAKAKGELASRVIGEFSSWKKVIELLLTQLSEVDSKIAAKVATLRFEQDD